MAHDLKIGNQIFEDVNKITVENTSGNNVEFIVSTDVPTTGDTQHFAYGYKTMTANTDFSITGIVDQQGKSFTPKGYAFALLPNESANYTGGGSAPSVVSCVRDTITNKQTRIRTADAAWKAFSNVSSSSNFQVGDGYFKLLTSTDTKYNCFGAKYFWVCWG